MTSFEDSTLSSDASDSGGAMTSFDSSLRSSIDSESLQAEQTEDEEFDVDPEFKEQFDKVKSEYENLQAQSMLIQRKLLEVFSNLNFDDNSSTPTADFSTKYEDTLITFENRRTEYEELQAKNKAELDAMTKHCTSEDRERLTQEANFRAERETTAKGSIVPKTNKPLNMSELNTKENQLSEKEVELEKTRIKYIRTKNLHKQVEDELNAQDQLSEGLHLIDFEQLKIENQALSDKATSKTTVQNEIRKKIEINAHMLTHVTEKLHFVRKERAKLEAEQKEVDELYTKSRAKLANARIKRDKVRDDNSSLKKSSGLIGMTDLLYDFENRSNELEMMQDKVTELNSKFNDLVSMQHEIEAKIAQRQPLDPSLLRMNR